MRTVGLCTVAIVVLVLAPSVIAQDACTAQTVAGTYALTCNGWVALPNQPQILVQFAAQGNFYNEVVGREIKSSGTMFESIGGAQAIATHWVTPNPAAISGDCTVNLTFDVTYPDESVQQVHIYAAVVDEGKEFRSLDTDAGVVSTCSAKLITRQIVRPQQ